MFEQFKKLLKKTKKVEEPKPAPAPKKTAKEIATEKGEPYVAILKFDLDSENMHQGAFELDWNDKFITNLVRSGYRMNQNDTDADIVDRWFQNICRHVVMETWEQEQAINPSRFTKVRNIGDGRSEVS
jgi:hypothetical protein